MQAKKQRSQQARQIRHEAKAAGVTITLPESIRIVKQGLFGLLADKSKCPPGIEVFAQTRCECCGPEWGVRAVGPKGQVVLSVPRH